MKDLGLLATSSAFLLLALYTRGNIAPKSRFTQALRAQYVMGSPVTTWLPFGFRLAVAATLPLFFSLFLIAWLPLIPHDERAIGWAIIVGAALCWILTAIAFIWPTRFLPQWMRDVDAGRDIGLDLQVLHRAAVAYAPLSRRTFRLANLAAVALLVLAAGVQAPTTVFVGLFISWSVLLSSQYAG